MGETTYLICTQCGEASACANHEIEDFLHEHWGHEDVFECDYDDNEKFKCKKFGGEGEK